MCSVNGFEEREKDKGHSGVDETPRFGNWVSLACGSDRFDINRCLVQCKFSTTDFMASIGGDAIVVVPATFRFASQMVAHAVLHGCDHGDGLVEIAVRRAAIRCARQYRFAYVDGRRYEVVGVSDDSFVFVHREGLCDCGGVDNDNGIEYDNGDVLKLESSTQSEIIHLASTIALDRPATTTVKLRSFVSSLMDMRSSHPLCTACKVPSNYRQVLECLTENVDHLSDVDSNVDRECTRCFIIIYLRILKSKIIFKKCASVREVITSVKSDNTSTRELKKNTNAFISMTNFSIIIK